jgi:hypothetical protein
MAGAEDGSEPAKRVPVSASKTPTGVDGGADQPPRSRWAKGRSRWSKGLGRLHSVMFCKTFVTDVTQA